MHQASEVQGPSRLAPLVIGQASGSLRSAAPSQIAADELTYDGVAVHDQNGLVHLGHLGERRMRRKARNAFESFPV
jgi:hypothetical protein